MYVRLRLSVVLVLVMATSMIMIVVAHIGGVVALRVGQFAPLLGALTGGGLTLVCASLPQSHLSAFEEKWQWHEHLSWLFIGAGMICWGIGESFWRYFVVREQAPFPSLADIGYTCFPVLVFVGLLLQPSREVNQHRLMLFIDSLVSTGAILAIAWYLLLGQLAQTPGEATLAKFLGLYYPVADTALLSCVVILLLRGEGPLAQFTQHRISLLMIGLGLCFFVGSDFVFNVSQNAGTYVEATWLDLGWPLGMLTIGLAAYFRRFPLAVPAYLKEQRVRKSAISPIQFVPYLLLVCVLIALVANVLSSNPLQQMIRPVLLFATLGVVCLVLIRQLYTLIENSRLLRQQTQLLEEQQIINKHIAEISKELEVGVEHLQDVFARLANGDLYARAALPSGHRLWTLAQSLNIFVGRLARAVSRPIQSTGRLSVPQPDPKSSDPF